MMANKVLVGLGLAVAVLQPVWADFPNGISSGDTTQTSTVLWARSSETGSVRFQVKDAGAIINDQLVTVADPLVPAKLRVNNLSAGKAYTYSVTSPTGLLATGSFKTAAATGANTALSFGVTGDWRGELAPYPAIKNVPAHSLNFFVKLGDTIYADHASPAVPNGPAQTLAEFRAKHSEVYSRHNRTNSFAGLQRNVSIFSMIDDHEVSNDFAGGALASAFSYLTEKTGLVNQSSLYNNGLQAFIEANAIEDRRYPAVGDSLTDGRPDLYRTQRYGSTAGIFILDARSFRAQELAGVTDVTSAAQIGGFIAKSFDAFTPATTRSMLGVKQLAKLKADLLAAQTDNVIWKFVAVPEPIQNMGVLAASDRFEGYASERSELLRFIDENGIKNVVFISADIHGTLINDLTYQRREEVLNALATVGNPLAAPQYKTSAFEITTGSVAYEPAFGDAVIGLLAGVPNGNLLLAQLFAGVGVSDLQGFNNLPMAVKSAAMQALLDSQLNALGYTPVGLQDNNLINAKLLQGTNSALFSFGWTRFDIHPKSHALRITTYGIEPYTAQNLADNAAAVISRQPQVVSQLLVQPK
jgi:phosphodiesterase/alkaline phosphatase D-like protein